MSRQLRVAVVGLGIGREHMRAWRELPAQFELVALCDVDRAKVERVAERAGVPQVFTDLDELLRTCEADVVDLATPPHLHFEQCRAVLASGRHAICEKPLVASLAQADALARAEAESGRRLMPIFQYRFGAGVQKLRHLVERGLVGRHYLATVETAWLRGADYYAVPWRGRWKSELGGVLLGHAIHAHDLLCWVAGPIRSVFGRTTTRVNPIETEDCASASLELADGSLATLSATLGSRVEISRLRFCFERVTAESNLSPYTPGADPWTFSAADPEAQAAIDAALSDFAPGLEGYAGQFARLHEALVRGADPPVTIADARASLELITALYHSAETGQAIALPLAADHPRYESWLPERAR